MAKTQLPGVACQSYTCRVEEDVKKKYVASGVVGCLLFIAGLVVGCLLFIVGCLLLGVC